ncbi:GNAT family N-acetyltransferase [Rhodococcus aetherivorans]
MSAQPADRSAFEFDIRVLTDERDLIAALEVFRTAMVGLPWSVPLSPDVAGKFFESGRTLGAFADGELVGTVDSTRGSLTLPGGRTVAHAAVTHIGVLPTHTRRGIVSHLVRRQLTDARATGEVVATLRASEATIYGRFGYGIASRVASVTVDTRRGGFRPEVPAGDPVRLLPADQMWDVLPTIHARIPNTRPGFITRSSQWWAAQELRYGQDRGPAYTAVTGPEGAETGFVRYHPVGTETWFGSNERSIVVDDLFAPSREAFIGLIRFLWELDLVNRIVFPGLPVDTSLPWLLTDQRAVATTHIRDETWLRILDVEAALRARTYGDGGSLVLAVHDPLLPENTGTYRIADGHLESVTPGLAADADLETDVSTLGSALLGSERWHRLAYPGTVRIGAADALTHADRLFATGSAAFAGTNF